MQYWTWPFESGQVQLALIGVVIGLLLGGINRWWNRKDNRDE